MDGINFIDPTGSKTSRPRSARRWSGNVQRIALMAAIIVATLMTIIALDYAGIHLPAGSDPLSWPPLG